MEIRQVEPNYKEQAKRLWMYCFGMSEEVVERILSDIFKPDICLGAFIENDLVACLYILPFEIYFFQNSMKMGGIAGVATLPEYRRHYCARNLLIKALEVMKTRGQIFSMLAPFSYSFYRKYGWELCYHYKEYILNIEDFKKFGNGFGQFRPLNNEDILNMMEVYNKYMCVYNGAINRTKAQWERSMQKDGENVHKYGLFDEYGTLQGYILYTIGNGKFSIKELVYSSPKARDEIFKFIYMHSAQASQVVWRAPADDNTMLMLDNPRREIKIVPGMMARIVDLISVIKNYPFKTSCTGKFVLKVEDPWAPWNDGCFEVKIDSGKAEIYKIQDDKWDVKCSIGTLTQIMMGYTSISEANNTGSIQVEHNNVIDRLQEILLPKVTFMNDFF